MKYFAGIDIGGTNTTLGIINEKGDVVETHQFSTRNYETPVVFVEDVGNKLIELRKPYQLEGVGIGAPNGNYYTGTIEYAPNLLWKGVIPLAKLVAEKMGLPATLTNDANAAAVGEMMYGAARGMKDFIIITLGTGVGSGIVANGRLIYGHDGYAGELGHVIVRPGGRKHWGTGMRGSLETYVSATGIAITAREMLKQNREATSLLRNYQEEEIGSRIIYECAIKGDKIAQKVFRYTGKILGEALANFVMFSSPEAIILFGGVAKAGDLIMKPAKKYMEKSLLPIFQNKVKLIFSGLNEADAAILGASALVWEKTPPTPKGE